MNMSKLIARTAGVVLLALALSASAWVQCGDGQIAQDKESCGDYRTLTNKSKR